MTSSIQRFRFGLLLLLFSAVAAAEGLVMVTPLGSHDGEFCSRDRALIFEDPSGTRLLYDAGRTVAGAADARLGSIDVVLVSHMHGDHVGNRHIPGINAGSCKQPDTSVDATPVSNSVKIAAAKQARMVTGSEMPRFFAAKLKQAGGKPGDSLLVRFGASRQIGGVTITTVPATHSNGIAPVFIGDKLGAMLEAAGVTAYAGPPTGYVLQFSNGLVVYLSGDTGVTAEQDMVVRQQYAAELVVMNIGDTFTTGPRTATRRGDMFDQVERERADQPHRKQLGLERRAHFRALGDGEAIGGTELAGAVDRGGAHQVTDGFQLVAVRLPALR
mgnify:CR=1 FL=1